MVFDSHEPCFAFAHGTWSEHGVKNVAARGENQSMCSKDLFLRADFEGNIAPFTALLHQTESETMHNETDAMFRTRYSCFIVAK